MTEPLNTGHLLIIWGRYRVSVKVIVISFRLNQSIVDKGSTTRNGLQRSNKLELVSILRIPAAVVANILLILIVHRKHSTTVQIL